MAYRRPRSRKPKARKGRRNARVQRRMRLNRRGSSEWASAKQTVALGDDLTSTVYILDNINLAQFDRLSVIASAYQYFRITHVEYKLTPYFDTFKPGEVSTVPYLYWLINKGDAINTGSFNALRDAGAKPIRFDGRTITIRWKPAVLQMLRDVVGGPTVVQNYSMGKVSPWLTTNNFSGSAPPSTSFIPNQVEHTGILYGVQGGAGSTPVAYGASITVHVQYKKPLNWPGTGVEMPPAVSKSMEPRPDPLKPTE